MDYSALAEQVRGLGAYKAGVVDLQDVRFDRAFRAMCETNACGNYGKCWMCPPDAGDIDALMNEAQSYQKALVYQTVGTLEDSYDFEGMMEAARLHNELSRALAKWFATLPFAKKLHLGAGGCHMCGVCAKRTNEHCRAMNPRRKSVSSFIPPSMTTTRPLSVRKTNEFPIVST